MSQPCQKGVRKTLSDLPKDMHMAVLSFLGGRCIFGTASRVSKYWRSVATKESFPERWYRGHHLYAVKRGMIPRAMVLTEAQVQTDTYICNK
jgi:hypothetical protein